MDDMVLVKFLEQEAASWDLRICPGARHPDAVNRNAHAKRRADLLRSAAATITAWNTRAASGGDSASLEQRAAVTLPHDIVEEVRKALRSSANCSGTYHVEQSSKVALASLEDAITAALANQQGVGGSQAECDRRGKLLADLYNCDEAQIPVALLRRISACLMGMDEPQPAGDVGRENG